MGKCIKFMAVAMVVVLTGCNESIQTAALSAAASVVEQVTTAIVEALVSSVAS
jgi:hypothetical protein